MSGIKSMQRKRKEMDNGEKDKFAENIIEGRNAVLEALRAG